MPRRTVKRIKWVMLIIILIFGLLESAYLTFDARVTNNSHNIGCATFPPSLSLKGLVMNDATNEPIVGAVVTVQHWKRLTWTCENYDHYPQMMTETDYQGEFTVLANLEQNVRLDITISAAGCQTLIESVTSDSLFFSTILANYRPAFTLKCQL
jgi:hypothetical protein